MLFTNYMLETLCWKETTCCETYSRMFMLWSILQTRNNMFKGRCAKKVHSDDVLHKKNYMLRALCKEETTYSGVLQAEMTS